MDKTEYGREWRKNHPEKTRAYAKKWRDAHPGYMGAKAKEWKASHPNYNAEWLSNRPEYRSENAKRNNDATLLYADNHRTIWSDSEKDYIIMNYNKMTSKDMALDLGRTQYGIRSMIYKLRKAGEIA